MAEEESQNNGLIHKEKGKAALYAVGTVLPTFIAILLLFNTLYFVPINEKIDKIDAKIDENISRLDAKTQAIALEVAELKGKMEGLNQNGSISPNIQKTVYDQVGNFRNTYLQTDNFDTYLYTMIIPIVSLITISTYSVYKWQLYKKDEKLKTYRNLKTINETYRTFKNELRTETLNNDLRIDTLNNDLRKKTLQRFVNGVSTRDMLNRVEKYDLIYDPVYRREIIRDLSTFQNELQKESHNKEKKE